MRRGHRLDNLDSTWTTTADRPWYPPLYTEGFPKPSEVGDRIRRLSLPIHRVFVSPFLRCVQTAAHVVEALRVDDDDYGERIDLKITPSHTRIYKEVPVHTLIYDYQGGENLTMMQRADIRGLSERWQINIHLRTCCLSHMGKGLRLFLHG
ncbi:hypothetical protein Droror1_Dr00005060 [Drosera rotundifolia]